MLNKNIIIFIIILFLIYIKCIYIQNIETFKNDILCKNDCKCMYNDNNQKICGRKDTILGILECEGCNENLYNELCSDCKESTKPNINSFTKKKCNNCMLNKESCNSCTNCVWCNDTNSCIQGDIIGPSEGLKCSNWEYYNKNEDIKFPLYDLDKRTREFNFQNILKYDNFIKYSDYNKNIINRENNKINQYTNTYNNILLKQNINNQIYNLSIKQIFQNISTTCINILNDIPIFFNNTNNITFNNFINIFSKDNRLIYIGILIILFSFTLFIISFN
jgi:hypothetical protein